MIAQSNISSKIIDKIVDGVRQQKEDFVVVEEPLEIRVRYAQDGDYQSKSIAVTMRTPGNDRELALGFLFTEGIIEKKQDSLIEKFVAQNLPNAENIIEVNISPDKSIDLSKINRNFYTTSSCGICGKASIDLVTQEGFYFHKKGIPKILDKVILSAALDLKKNQINFKKTGGIHAVAIHRFDGQQIVLREDVGRHNAMDKCIGHLLLNQLLPGDEYFSVLSGRASFELVQKAHLAGISVIVAIGAPSSLAVELAEETGITLIGFAKESSFNIYSNPNRIYYV